MAEKRRKETSQMGLHSASARGIRQVLLESMWMRTIDKVRRVLRGEASEI